MGIVVCRQFCDYCCISKITLLKIIILKKRGLRVNLNKIIIFSGVMMSTLINSVVWTYGVCQLRMGISFNLLLRTNRYVLIKTCKKIFDVYVWSVFLYGSECWTVRKKDKVQLERISNNFLNGKYVRHSASFKVETFIDMWYIFKFSL